MNPFHRQLQNRKQPDREVGWYGRTNHLQTCRYRIRHPTRRIPDAEVSAKRRRTGGLGGLFGNLEEVENDEGPKRRENSLFGLFDFGGIVKGKKEA